MMLSNIAIASLAFGSAGLVASSVQSQLVHACAFAGRVVPQKGHCRVSKLTGAGCGGASVYSILELNRYRTSQEPPNSSSIPCHSPRCLRMYGLCQWRRFLRLSNTRTSICAFAKSKIGQTRSTACKSKTRATSPKIGRASCREREKIKEVKEAE